MTRTLISLPLILLSIFTLSSCNNNHLEKAVQDMLGKETYLDTCNFIVIKGLNPSTPDNRRFTLITYYDSIECMSCVTSKLHRWNKLIKNFSNDGVEVLFIFSPRSTERESLKYSILSERLQQDVYLDTCNLFQSQNKWIPKFNVCHTFLVDSQNRVQMVGDPRRTERLMKMFVDIVRDSIDSN